MKALRGAGGIETVEGKVEGLMVVQWWWHHSDKDMDCVEQGNFLS